MLPIKQGFLTSMLLMLVLVHIVSSSTELNNDIIGLYLASWVCKEGCCSQKSHVDCNPVGDWSCYLTGEGLRYTMSPGVRCTEELGSEGRPADRGLQSDQ